MALRRRQAFRDNPELQQFVIPEARPTGRQLGVGSYDSVEELQVKGLVCAGKRMHEALLERDNEGVGSIERKFFEECQVTPRTILVSLKLYSQANSPLASNFVAGDGEDAASPRSTVLGPVLLGRVNASHAGDGANGQQPR